jgi:hypothetical protein
MKAGIGYWSDSDNVDCLQAFGTFFDREFHLLAFLQGPVAVHLNGGIMDEDI